MLENKLYKESCDEVLLSRGNDKGNRTVVNIKEGSVFDFLKQLQKGQEAQMTTLLKQMTLGEFIKEAYLEPLQITEYTLAEKLNVSNEYVTKLLNGKVELDNKVATMLSEIFDCSAESLLNLKS